MSSFFAVFWVLFSCVWSSRTPRSDQGPRLDAQSGDHIDIPNLDLGETLSIPNLTLEHPIPQQVTVNISDRPEPISSIRVAVPWLNKGIRLTMPSRVQQILSMVKVPAQATRLKDEMSQSQRD